MEQKFTPEDKMTDLIKSNPMILMSMSRFGISLGFGDKSVKQICAEQGIDCSTFLAIANYITYGEISIHNISIEALLSYLHNAHSYFLDFCLPMIRRKLIEAIDCSGRNEIAMLILKFYDSYVDEVNRHMDYENRQVFTYVANLLKGNCTESYNIGIFASNHHSIHNKLKELKDIIIRYLPQKDNNLLNAVLFDIINCEEDLIAHCRVEDVFFVPAVKKLEEEIIEKNIAADFEQENETETIAGEPISPREREIIECVALGLSNKEIADRLHISVNTVTTHRRNLAQKLQIHSPAGLAIYAVINGIVDINKLS